MKIFSSYIFRSLCMFMIGLLLVLNPDTPAFIVQVIGALFAFSGLMSILHYIRARFSKSAPVVPVFPLTGLGSIGLGVLLGLFPDKFIFFRVDIHQSAVKIKDKIGIVHGVLLCRKNGRILTAQHIHYTKYHRRLSRCPVHIQWKSVYCTTTNCIN